MSMQWDDSEGFEGLLGGERGEIVYVKISNDDGKEDSDGKEERGEGGRYTFVELMEGR
jgi:hypothetical protein